MRHVQQDIKTVGDKTLTVTYKEKTDTTTQKPSDSSTTN